jgi:hypothetical protein
MQRTARSIEYSGPGGFEEDGPRWAMQAAAPEGP